MPVITLPVYDTDISVTRAITFAVVNQLGDWLDLREGTKIVFPGNIEETYQPGSPMASNRDVDFGSSDKLFITVTERISERMSDINQLIQPNNQFSFEDDELRVFLRPTFVFTEARVNIRYRARDETEAIAWRDRIRSKLLRDAKSYVHSADFSYIIPEVALYILKMLHDMREAKYPLGEDFPTWLKRCSGPKMTLTTNVAGGAAIPKQEGVPEVLRIADRMGRIQGWFEEPLEIEKPSPQNGKQAWETGLDYVFEYDRVTEMAMGYPFVVHNTLVPKKLRPKASPDIIANIKELLSMQNYGLRYFEATDVSWRSWLGRGVAIPTYDDFIPNQVLPSSNRVATMLTALEDDDQVNGKIPPGSVLLNLEEIFSGDDAVYELKPHILEFIRSEARFITKPFASIFSLSLYYWNDLATSEKVPVLSMDDQLVVRSTVELDPRVIHHVRLGLFTDLDLLDPGVVDRIKDNFCVLKDLMESIKPDIDLSFVKPVGGECGSVTDNDWDKIVDQIRTKDRSPYKYVNTISTMFIVADKRSDDDANDRRK